MHIISLSEYQFSWLRKKNKPNEKWACIRIASHKSDCKHMSKAFLRQFQYVWTEYFTEIEHPIMQNGIMYTPYTKSHHERMLQYIRTCEKKGITHVYIHCHAGVARSTAVVKGICAQNPQFHEVHMNGDNIYPYPPILHMFDIAPQPIPVVSEPIEIIW